jgi:hypothetical protein
VRNTLQRARPAYKAEQRAFRGMVELRAQGKALRVIAAAMVAKGSPGAVLSRPCRDSRATSPNGDKIVCLADGPASRLVACPRAGVGRYDRPQP